LAVGCLRDHDGKGSKKGGKGKQRGRKKGEGKRGWAGRVYALKLGLLFS
jgi:hypothetical protein